MTYTMEEKYELIEEACLKSASKNPVVIAKEIMKKDYVNMHGPEHHLLDGAAFLTAYKNAGGNIDLKASIERLAQRSILMPGATCGNWGVCGASSSIGAALSIIHGVGPLSSDQYYKDDMEYTSRVLKRMSLIGG